MIIKHVIKELVKLFLHDASQIMSLADYNQFLLVSLAHQFFLFFVSLISDSFFYTKHGTILFRF